MGGRGSGGSKNGGGAASKNIGEGITDKDELIRSLLDCITVFQEIQLIQLKKEYEPWSLSKKELMNLMLKKQQI